MPLFNRTGKTALKTLFVSDSAALGLMEARPEPAWRVRTSVLRNKELLAPDYGAMHVAAYLKEHGFSPRVVNLVADIQPDARAFAEPETDPSAISRAGVASLDAAERTREYLATALADEAPDVVFLGVSVYNLALHGRRLLGDVRRACPGARLVTGGIYSSFHAREILEDGHVDAVVRGEGEITAAALLQRLAEGRDLYGLEGVSFRDGARIVHNDRRPHAQDLDALPHPYTVSGEFRVARRFEILNSILPEPDWIAGAGFLTSRGCPEGCTFCLDPAINRRRTRMHSPGYVRDVLDFCAREFPGGSGAFFFGDAAFTMNRKRARRIMEFMPGTPFTYHIQTRADYLDDGLISDLAAAGVTDIAIGAETFNERILREVVRKRLDVSRVLEAARAVRAAGMRPMLTFIVGLPGETRESVMSTVEILRDNGLFDATFFPLVVFRGTALFEYMLARVGPEGLDPFRINPMSEEFLCASDEFPAADDLTGFTDLVNAELAAARPGGM